MKKFISLLLACCLTACCTLSAFADDTVDDLQARQQELEQQNKEYEEILRQTKEDIEKQQEYVDALSKKIDVTNEQISLIQSKIYNLEQKIESLQAEIEKSQKDIEEGMDTLRGRIRTIYMAGNVSSLDIILGAKDFSDFLDKLQLVKSVSDFDQKLINGIKEQLKEITETKSQVENDKKSLEDEQNEFEQKQAEYEDLLDENKDALELLYDKSEDAEQIIDDNHAEINAIDDEIEAYYAEQKRLQEEEEKKQQATKPVENEPDNSSDDNNDDDDDDDNNNSYAPSGSGYIWPCPGFYYLSSEWNEDRGSYNHGAIDIAGSGIMWSNVLASASGTVVIASNTCSHNYGKYYSCGCGGGYGNYVWIDHGNGKATVYAHLSDLTVSEGDYVSAGQLIGYVGSTGHSTGPHLHYETRYYGERYNPMTEF